MGVGRWKWEDGSWKMEVVRWKWEVGSWELGVGRGKTDNNYDRICTD